MRDDHRDRDQRDAAPAAAIRSAGATPPPDRVPETHRSDNEADVLLRQAGETADDGEQEHPVLIEQPEAGEQQRCGERDRMEVVDDEPLARRVEQVDEREAEPRPLRPRCLRASRKTGTAPAATAIA